MSTLGWTRTDNLVVQLQRVQQQREHSIYIWKGVAHTLSLHCVGAIWLQIPSEFLAVTIELALVIFSTFADKVIIRDGKFVSFVQRLELGGISYCMELTLGLLLEQTHSLLSGIHV